MARIVNIVFFTILTITYLWGQKVDQNNIPKHVNNHYIILVDQTIQSHPNTKKIYSKLDSLFHTPKRSSSLINFSFNPVTDDITIYAFYISGSGISGRADYHLIRQQSYTQKSSSLNNQISEKLFHYIANYKSASVSIDTFLDSYLKPCFQDNNKCRQDITANSAISLSQYVYPLILNKFQPQTPATKYEFIVVSDYLSGESIGSAKDDKIMMDLIGGKFPIFKGWIKQLKAPFDLSDDFDICINPSPQDNKNPIAKAYILKPKSLDDISLNIPSNISLKQKKYNSEEFTLEPIEIHFGNLTGICITDIILEISDAESNTIFQKRICSSDKISQLYDTIKQSFILNQEIINLPKDYRQNKTMLNFSYVFHASILDATGNSILPYCFKTAPRSITLQNGVELASAPNEHLSLIIVLSVILLALISTVLFILWKRRGENTKLYVKCITTPISSTKYMDVSNNKVVNYDCWYKRDSMDRKRIIKFAFHISPETKQFAKKCKYIFKYKVQDIDTNEIFSFRPDGKDQNGIVRNLNVVYTSGNSFEFENNCHIEEIIVEAFVNDGLEPDFSIDNILKTKVSVYIYLETFGKNGRDEKLIASKDVTYSFIVKPQIDNQNLWVALDPGTTGSCIAYGAAAMPTDSGDIRVAQQKEYLVGGNERDTPVFPSVVHIPSNSILFKGGSIEKMKIGKDYEFGTAADKKTYNKYQSIKKLLGYTTRCKVYGKDDEEKEIKGQDLAHLLVEGLFEEFQKALNNDKTNEGKQLKDAFYNNGEFNPQRAIVAVPNNYTLNKVQEMVDSVKRLNLFKEVHYLYESESVFMTYLREEYKNLPDQQNKIFLVYDMGGATINITVFQLHVATIPTTNGKGWNIQKIEVETLAKIGYCVGGDDIDFAILQVLYGIPSIKGKFNNDENAIKKHQLAHKDDLIKIARKIKLDLISKNNNKNLADNVTGSFEKLWEYIKSEENTIVGGQLSEIEDGVFEKDKKYWDVETKNHSKMKDYVFKYVEDAVNEILQSIPKEELVLIMSGRSVLYPGIKESVETSIKSNGFKYQLWRGFVKDDNSFDDIRVKSAVATGACWYAMYSSMIELNHRLLTSTFGYIDQSNGENIFVPLIEKGSRFVDDKICGDKTPQNPMLHNVRFVQMLGHDYQKIYSIPEKLKFNRLDEVKQDQIQSNITKIHMDVDECDNYSYEISVAGEPHPVTREQVTLFKGEPVSEISEEQSDAYVFATLQTQHPVTPIRKNNNSVAQTGNNKKGRF